MECPDDNVLAEFMQGLLSGERRREVEAHMDACANCTSLVVGVGRTFDRGEDLPSQTKVGRYEVLECIGRGAMGTVYAARDPLLARTVALKVLHSSGGLGEAQALARLSHPNVVSIYDVGEDNGRVYLAMERVSGTTLSRWLQTERRPWRAIVDVFVDAANALAAAHAAGVVHGDFKPDNVIVSESGRVAVTDFGLARIIAEEPSVVAGTPAYMAPEQLKGGSATPASDQFAFATALHEALYGTRMVVTAAPDGHDAPHWLFPIIARSANQEPRARYESMEALRKRIAGKLAGDVHYTVNAMLQLGMFVFHATITTLFVWALLSPETPPAAQPASEHKIRMFSTVIAYWLAGLFFLGWAPLGIVWTPINAYGLFKKRRWALTSTLVYALFSTLTCIATPVSAYALLSLGPLRKKIATSS